MIDYKHVSTIVVHANCPDGIASAMQLRVGMPDARVVAVGYDKEREELPVSPGMLFCDMSPPVARVQEFVDAGAIVLDHHKTAKDIVAAFGENGVYGDEDSEPGVSGAVLACRLIWPPEKFAQVGPQFDFARIAGIRDTWQRSSPEWEAACKQGEMLRFLGLDRALKLGINRVMEMQGWLSDHLWARKMEHVEKVRAEHFRATVAGKRVAIIPGVDTVSDASDVIDADICAGFAYSGSDPVLTVSLRSRGMVDVGALAKSLGGGGHTGAAGFRLLVSSDDGFPNPYHAIVEALDRVLNPRTEWTPKKFA